MTRLTDDELTLRSATEEDAPLLNAWWNDGAIMAHAGFPNGLHEPLAQTIALVRMNEAEPSQRLIIERAGTPIGEMNFRIAPEGGEAEIGIKICDFSCQNRGYGTRLLRLLIRHLFTDASLNACVPIERIVLDTNLDNRRAQHVYEKIGFRRLRVRRDAWRDQLGRMQSAVDYELTRDDLAQTRA